MSLYLNRFYEEYDKIKEKNYIYNYKIEKNEGIVYRVVHDVPEDQKKLLYLLEFKPPPGILAPSSSSPKFNLISLQ